MSSLKEKRKRIQFVYKTTNLLNGTYYIGVHSTWNIDDGYLGSGKRLGRAIKKYGKENFKREILAFFDTNKEAYDYEALLVNEELIKDELCLNLKPGGYGGFSKEASIKGGKSFSVNLKADKSLMESHKKRASFNMKKLHVEGKIKYDTFGGKSHSEETKQKMSESSKNKGTSYSNSQFGTCWITDGTQNMKIRKDDSIPEGWTLGRKINKGSHS